MAAPSAGDQTISQADIAAGKLAFTPATNANGTGYDSFKFTVNDGTADSSASSTMTIDVTAVNDLPTAADKTVTATEDTAFVFALADFGFSDVDSGAQLQSIAVTTLSSTGTLTLNGSAVTWASRSAGRILRLATLNLHQRPMPMARVTTVSNLPSTTELLIRQRHRR